jgi:transposase-like protein
LIERGREYDTTHTEKLGGGHPLVTLKIYSFRYISKARISHKESFAMRRASSENVKINIVCTYCGMEHCKRLGWFRDHSSLSCGECGYEIALRNEQLRAAIEELRAVMSGLRRSSRAA